MSQITNDTEFKQALLGLDAAQQRIMAARFVEHVMALCTDERINSAMQVAAKEGVSETELSSALKLARAATMDSHTRCGAEGNWVEQAGYFVCRAAVAALSSPEKSKGGSPAWQAAMSSRMARTSEMIDEESGESTTHNESEWQYDALANYLNV